MPQTKPMLTQSEVKEILDSGDRSIQWELAACCTIRKFAEALEHTTRFVQPGDCRECDAARELLKRYQK